MPLENAWRGNALPALPGLYRIRTTGSGTLDYIGQTGTGTMTLRKRLAMLRGIYGLGMPYCDPHVAGPGLWALLRIRGVPFEVSVCPLPGQDTASRKSAETLEISLHRIVFQTSPTINFGRMPTGFIRSSHNNARLQAAGMVFRGGSDPLGAQQDYHRPGIKPQGGLDEDFHNPSWCGHAWAPWTPMNDAAPPEGRSGLYRIRRTGLENLIYLGQGRIAARLRDHMRKGWQEGHPQGVHFQRPETLEVSWTMGDNWLDHQRLELENDLIAAHVQATGSAPAAQFLG